jgi:hypothetical protein
MRILLSFILGATVMTAVFGGGLSAVRNWPQSEQRGAAAQNTVCPVTGDKVGSMGKPVYVDYQGKKVGLCCKMCLGEYRADPAKFAALAVRNGSTGSSLP